MEIVLIIVLIMLIGCEVTEVVCEKRLDGMRDWRDINE